MSWLAEAEQVDVAVYAAIAQTPTPSLDRAMSRLSHAANYSRLSIASAALLAAAGGRARGGAPRGARRARVRGRHVRRREPGRQAALAPAPSRPRGPARPDRPPRE